jgi:outer membrane protein assembly factor BamB
MTSPRKSKEVDRASLGSAPTSWTWFAGGPLRGCLIMREKQRIIAWDDGNTLYLFDLFGDLIADARVDKEIVGAAASDDGGAVAVVSRFGDLWWFDRDLQPCFHVQSPFDHLAVALDPHSLYAAVSGNGGQILVYARDGRKHYAFETRPPMKRLAFTAEGQIVGAADHGLLGMYDLQGRIYWESKPWSNVGGLAVDGKGEAILLACYGHGLLRFNGEGVKEGSYRLDGSPSLCAIDYFGRKILCTTLEQRLVELTFDGSILGTKPLPDEPVAVALDALGRYAVVAMKQGELRYFTLDAFFRASTDEDRAASAIETADSSKPAWSVRMGESVDDIDAIVLEPVPGKGAGDIAAYTRRRTVLILDKDGKKKHETGSIAGVGRALWTNDRWLIASTDGNLIAYDPSDNDSVKCTLPMYEISHLELMKEFGEFILVQSCEYVTRVLLPEDEIYRERLDFKVESTASQPDGTLAVTLDDHSLRIFSPKWKKVGRFKASPSEPLLVTRLEDGWATLGRESRTLRAHEPNGKLLWSQEIPWSSWGLKTIAGQIVVTGVEGESLLVADDGSPIAENREPRRDAKYFPLPDGKIGRVYVIHETIVVSRFGGKVLYRYPCEDRIGPFTVGEAGVWACVGRELCHFPFPK